MKNRVEVRPDAARRTREIVLAVLALWLVIQNVLLLALIPLGTVTSAATVIVAMVKVARLVFSQWTVATVAVVLGLAVVVSLLRQAERPLEAARVEVRHG